MKACEFAKYLKVSEGAVRRAIKEKRITATKDGARWNIDPETAAAEWARNSRYRIEASGANGSATIFVPDDIWSGLPSEAELKAILSDLNKAANELLKEM